MSSNFVRGVKAGVFAAAGAVFGLSSYILTEMLVSDAGTLKLEKSNVPERAYEALSALGTDIMFLIVLLFLTVCCVRALINVFRPGRGQSVFARLAVKRGFLPAAALTAAFGALFCGGLMLFKYAAGVPEPGGAPAAFGIRKWGFVSLGSSLVCLEGAAVMLIARLQNRRKSN